MFRLIEYLIPRDDYGEIVWDKFNKINGLYKETGGLDTGLSCVDQELLTEITRRKMKEMKEKAIVQEIQRVVARFYDGKSSIDQLNQFFARCLHGILEKHSWDNDILYLHQKLTEVRDLFEHDLSGVIYTDTIGDIVKQSQSDIFKQLWTDIISKQMDKYGIKGGIKVVDMDCIDVCLFMQALQGSQSMLTILSRGKQFDTIFKNKLDGKRWLQTKDTSFNMDGLYEMVNDNTKFEWNGKLSLQILTLIYEYMVKPAFSQLKQGIVNGLIPMKDVEYYFGKCGINTLEQVTRELDKCNITPSSTFAANIMNAIKCTQMLNDEMMIINFLSSLRDILYSSEIADESHNGNEAKYLKMDDMFLNVLQTLEQSQYPWNEENTMAPSGRQVLKKLSNMTEEFTKDTIAPGSIIFIT